VTAQRWQDILFFWAPLASLGAFMYWGLLVRFAGFPDYKKKGSNDLSIYRHAGEALLRGKVPYRDFFIEYPPGSLPAFVPPAYFSEGKLGFAELFASQMALLLVAVLVLTAVAARRLWGPWAWIVPALTIAAATIMLYNIALARYDALIALTLATAVFCATLGGRSPLLLAYASLGLGTAAKLVPALATIPLALVRRGAAWGCVIFFAVLVLFFAPAMLFGGDGFLRSFAYQAGRGLQVESVAASVLMRLGWVKSTGFAYGAFEARGLGVELASSLSLPLTGVLLLITALAMYRNHRLGRLGVKQYPRYASALILAFILGSKVLSPQYLVWLLPVVPLSAAGVTGIGISAVFLAAYWMTVQIITCSSDLWAVRSPGPELLLGRNLLLAVLWILLLLLPQKTSERERP